MSYLDGVLRLISINMISSIGFIMLAGWVGIFGLGHAGFIAIGAYVGSLTMMKLNLPWFLALLLGGIVAGIAAYLVGRPTLRLKPVYFTVASMALGETIRLTLDNLDFLGGSRGVTGIPIEFATLPNILIVVVLGVIVAVNIRHSKFGRSYVAIRDDALAAEHMGIKVARVKTTVFVISAIYCGVGGGFYAAYMTYIRPAMFSADMSSYLSTWAIFGGLGSLIGGLFGTFFLTALTESFRAFATYRMLFYGIALVIIIAIRPQGVFGTWELTPANLKKVWRGITRRKANDGKKG